MTDLFLILKNSINEIRDFYETSDKPAIVSSLERDLKEVCETEGASTMEALNFLRSYLVASDGDRGHDLMILDLFDRRRSLASASA